MEDNNSSTDEFEDASDLLHDDDDFLEMIDVPSSTKPKTLSKFLENILSECFSF